MPPAVFAYRFSSPGANHSPDSQFRNSSAALERVILKGSIAPGLIRRLDLACATRCDPQKGHLLSEIFLSTVDAALQEVQVTVCFSSDSPCSAARAKNS